MSVTTQAIPKNLSVQDYKTVLNELRKTVMMEGAYYAVPAKESWRIFLSPKPEGIGITKISHREYRADPKRWFDSDADHKYDFNVDLVPVNGPTQKGATQHVIKAMDEIVLKYGGVYEFSHDPNRWHQRHRTISYTPFHNLSPQEEQDLVKVAQTFGRAKDTQHDHLYGDPVLNSKGQLQPCIRKFNFMLQACDLADLVADIDQYDRNLGEAATQFIKVSDAVELDVEKVEVLKRVQQIIQGQKP